MKNKDLELSSYDYHLPDERIAARPIDGRSNSKLLVYDVKKDEVIHRNFYDIKELLPPESLLVLNESKVFPCRLIGKKRTGGKCEIFLLSLLESSGFYPALIKTSTKKNIGDEFVFGELVARIEKRDDDSFYISFNTAHEDLLNLLEKVGQIPIPPYIRGGVADEKDRDSYQTVYAGTSGSVAAPTAGLHFTKRLLSDLQLKGIDHSFVTLHVGAGTFKPVVTDSILEHKMHAESFFVTPKNLEKINSTKKRFAVGTTSLRVLESCSDEDGHIHFNGNLRDTDIFLYPGKKVHSIDGLITNFHLPKSTLLMLVSALVGREKTLELYDVAIKNDYRFFSYGDAMLILL